MTAIKKTNKTSDPHVFILIYPVKILAVYLLFFELNYTFLYTLAIIFYVLHFIKLQEHVNLKQRWSNFFRTLTFKSALHQISIFLMAAFILLCFYFGNYIAVDAKCGYFCRNSMYLQNLIAASSLFGFLFFFNVGLFGIVNPNKTAS